MERLEILHTMNCAQLNALSLDLEDYELAVREFSNTPTRSVVSTVQRISSKKFDSSTAGTVQGFIPSSTNNPLTSESNVQIEKSDTIRKEFITILSNAKSSGVSISQSYRLYKYYANRYRQTNSLSDFLFILDPASEVYRVWSDRISRDISSAEKQLQLLLSTEKVEALTRLQKLPISTEFNNIFDYIERYESLCVVAEKVPSFEEMKLGITVPFLSQGKTTSKLMDWLKLFEDSQPQPSIQEFLLTLLSNKLYFPHSKLYFRWDNVAISDSKHNTGDLNRSEKDLSVDLIRSRGSRSSNRKSRVCFTHGTGNHDTDFCKDTRSKEAPICIFDAKEGGCNRVMTCGKRHPSRGRGLTQMEKEQFNSK
jgi:hypothetical protein